MTCLLYISFVGLIAPSLVSLTLHPALGMSLTCVSPHGSPHPLHGHKVHPVDQAPRNEQQGNRQKWSWVGLNPAIFKVRSHQGSTATSCNTCSNKNYYKCLIIPIIICISINTRITKNILECFNQIYQ